MPADGGRRQVPGRASGAITSLAPTAGGSSRTRSASPMTSRAHPLVPLHDLVRRRLPRREQTARGRQQGIALVVLLDLAGTSVRRLDVRARVTQEPHRVEVQHRRPAGPPHQVDHAGRPLEQGRGVGSVDAHVRDPREAASIASGQPRGDGVLIPIRLSSHTKRTGQGTSRWARYAAAFSAPVAVEWLAEASPKLQTTIASSGHGVRRPRARASPREKARPTARGRWEPMVEVCGTMCRSGWPKTLCRPPDIGSRLDEVRLSSRSRTGLLCPASVARAR